MASNYERIQASRQRFREQAQISEDSYNKFRQAYVQQVDGDALAAGAKESADRMRQTLRESTGPAKPQQVQRAFAAYNSQIQRLRAYTQAGGRLPGDTRMAQLEREFAQQRADFTAYLRQQQSRQGQPGGALGRQTVDAAQAADDNRFALRRGKKAAEVFLDASRLTPQQQKAMAGGYASYDTSGDVDRTILAALTGSGTLKPGVLENAQRNRQRAAYQEAAQAARDSGAVRAGQYNQAQEKLDLVDDAITALEKMYPTKDARVLSSQQGMMRSYADRLGITDYTDRDDLLQQLRAQRSRQTRSSDRQAAAAAEQATRYRTAQALEYQLDNPDESLDANYLKRQRDEAKRAYAEKKTFRTRAAYEQAEAAYQERKYRDDQEKTVLEIRQDGGLSKQYQTALEAARGLTAAEQALQYVKSDLERDGAVNRDTLGQVREITGAAGLTLPAGKTDNELRAYLEKLTARYRSDKNFALANLQHAGYDADKLDEYISRALNAQRMDEYTGRAEDFAADSPVGASAASSAANLVSGMGYLAALPRTVANAWRIHTGNPDAYVPLDENSDAFRATRYAETIRQEVARQLQGKTDGKTASFLYDTGMSMLDNILQVGVGMGLLGAPAMAEAAASGGVSAAVAAGSAAASPVSLGMMGLTTASQKLLEMTDEGVDTTTAYNLATAAGAIEVLTEKIGLDEFINGLGRQTAATTLRRIGQQVGRQTLAEGTEEAASDVLNLAADLLLRMDQADFVRDIDRARRQGLSKGEAVWSVVEDQLKQTGVSFAGGALSGALFGLGGAAMNAVSSTDRAMGRQIQRTGGMEQLQKDAAAYGLNADNLTRESSPKALGAMQRQVYRAAEQTAGEIEAFAKQKGYKKAAADALQAAWQGYKETGLDALSPQEFGVAFDTAYQEGRLDAQYGQTGAYLERAATDALTAGLLPETVKYAYLAGTKDGSRAAKRTQSPVHALRERAAERRARRADASEAAATGAAQPGGGLTVMQLDDYTAKLRTAEGKTVTADQLETDAPERKIILQAQDDGYGPQEANALLAHYDGSMAPEAYYEQFREAITAGQDGESLSEARRRAGSGLTAEATKAAWELGQEIQTFLDTDERVGPAGKQALDAMVYGDAGLFEAYYKAGLAGESFAEARGRIGQMTAALEAKLRAAVKAGARDAQGGFTYGRQNSGNGQGRQGSVDPSGRGGRVAEGAEHEQSGAGAAEERSSGEAAGQDTGAAQVSAKALGVPEGTDRATARVLTAEEQTPEQRAKVAEYAKAGAELVLIEGNLEIQGETGTMHARGARIGDRIVVSVNDEGATWEQIARHEAKHRYFEQHPDAVQQEWEQVTGYMDADSIEEWLAYYAGKYAALGDIVDIAYIQEEALCDLAGGVETGKATEKDYRALETVKERAQKNTAQAGSRASIAESEKGRYVQADRQVLQGDDPGRWGRQIETYINEKIRNREDVIFPTEDGHLLALTGRSAYKLTDRHKSQIAKEGRVMLDDASYGVKLRAAAHIDELVQVGRFDRYIEDRRGAHENDIGEDGFNYYTAYFRDFDGSYYRVTFSAGVNENNETVYSIGRIRKRESITRRGSSSGVEAGGAQSRRNRLSSNRSIADRNGNVKGKTAVELAFERAREKKSRLSVAETQTGRSTRYSYAGENANGANSQTLQEYEVQTALWDAMDHADRGDENVIKLGRMPRYVRTLTGIDGDFYIYRNHAYENMATREQAERAGRPTRRGRQDIHFHGLGIDTMTEAILSTEDPLVTIWEKSKDGNPVISMVLPVKDADGAPLYAVMGFYTSNPINGQMKVRPHVLLTISNRALFGEGRRGTVEAINDAIAEKRILSMADIKKVRANLTLTGQHTKLASVTVNALSQNVAQFQREVKQFRAKNKINYSAASTQADGAIKQNDATEQDTAADWTAESQDLAAQLADATKRNKALEAVNRKLREQMKVTPPDTADQRELRGAAKRLAENYGGGLRQKDLTKQLQRIWRLRAEAQRGSEENRREKRGQMNEELEQLAAELTRNYLDKDNPEAETLREIKQTVRATKIYLTPELRSGLDRDGGYQDFRRRNFGRIRLANSGLGVDQFYQELSERWPAYFPAGIWNSADQLMQIADVIQDGTTILERSPYGDMDGMQYMKTRILWELGAVPAAQPTLADQAAQGAYREEALRRGGPGAGKEQLIDATAAHEQEQMDKLDAWYRDHLRKVKADREDQIQKVKDRYQERAQAERDRKAEQELKRRLLWHGNRLKRMGRTATPEQQAEIERIIGDLNTTTVNLTKTAMVHDYVQGMSTEGIPASGYRDKANPMRIMSPEEAAQNPEMRGNKVVDVTDLRAWYEDQKRNNPDFIADGRIEDILANQKKKHIADMTPQEVQQLLDVALNIENEIRTQKKLIDAADRREIYQQVLQIVGDIEGTRGRYDRGKLSRPAQWITENTLTPVRLLRRWTGFHDSDPLYQAALALQDGELKQLDYQRRAYEKFEEFTKDKKFMDHLAGKGKQKPIEVTGINEKGETVHVKITPDMRVALYLHSRNYQNLRHIQRGGITVPQYEAYVKGNYTEAYDRGTRLRLMPRDVRAITDKMTTREKNYAERVAQYYDTMSKAEINGVSVKLKGYEIAKVQRYYPIETDKAFIAKEFDALRYDGSVEGKGFLKERQEGGNPILLRDATRTLQKSIRDHALYVGMAIPIRNFNKLRGVSISKSDETGALRYQENSLMKALEEKWGTKAVKHLEQMVTDLSGAQPPQASGAEMLNRIRSNYAGAVLELNPSTAIKQLIAYPSAASVLGWDAMAVGLTKWQKVDVKLISKYTPLLWHRMQGFIDADLGDYAKNHGHTPRFLNWNQAGDLAVVKQIWKAAEWKVAHDDRTLLHDVEKWRKATAELFNRVVLESQANYTTMERGEILRTNNVFLRSIAMFKTEPFQAFNVLYDAFANTAAKRRQLAALQQQEEQATAEELTTAENAYRDAKKRIAQAIPAVIASNLLEASIVFAWALFRGKDKDWRDEETDEITAASFFKRLAVTAAGNISGIIPYGSEITELLQAAIGGDRYYGVDILEASALTDMAETLLDIKNTVAKMFEKKETDEERLAAWGDTAKELVEETLQVLQTLGLPADNIRKSVDAIARWALRIALGKDAGEYTYRYYTQKSTATGRAAEDAETLLQLALDGENEKLEQAYKMATRIRKADDVGKAVADRVKARVKAGTLDAETAAELLQRFQPDKDADELYWKAREWAYKAQTGAESFGKYTILKDAIFSGGDAAAALQELEDHGVSREDAEGEIRSTIGQWYQGKSADGRTVDRDEAVKLLQEYGGNSKHDAEEAVTKWDCYVETGIDYSDLKQQYVDGTLSGSEAKQYLQEYGDKRDREADKQIKQWDCKKDTGIDFDDIKAEYLAGSIDKNKAAELRQKYGGSSEEDAQTLVLQWDCKKDTDIDYEDIKWALIDGDITEAKAAELWKKYGGKDDGEAANKAAAWKLLGQHQELIDQYDSVESLAIKYIQHGNGAPIADFFDYYRNVKSFEADRDAEGKTISGSRKDKVVAYIADLPLTAAQKDGLMLADNAKYKLDDMPW